MYTGRLNILFGFNEKVAVQDPAYPVYVDSSVIFGRSGNSRFAHAAGIFNPR